jgi:putative tricarboxylic transport membrane protein
MLENMLSGAIIALQPGNILFCVIGVCVGTLIGVLPGIGPVAAISLLLPLTIGLDPTSAIIMISGIYYGTAYGGSIMSILINVPGEASTVVTCMDGHQMARQGRAGTALALAAFGSFLAGTLGTVGIATLSEPVMRYAVRLGPPEYFALMLLA